ncbi:hypothetical protein, partial [Nostoc sp. CALU 1950]|uniref:hypothetical protein n=1 Tax=Nostoc sp. CALU 1950 TaxID=3104321 RepID=UPI003EC0F3D9
NIFWAVFIGFFLTFNTFALNHIVSTRLSNQDYEQLVNTAKLHKLTITSLIRGASTFGRYTK